MAMAMACDLHFELVYKHAGKTLWELWKAIEAKHVKQGASIRYAPWVGHLGLCQGLDEPDIDYMARSEDGRNKIDCVMPANLSFDRRMDELPLFVTLCGMCAHFVESDVALANKLAAERVALVSLLHLVINLTLTSGLYRGACSRTIESSYIGEAIYEGEAVGRRRRGM